MSFAALPPEINATRLYTGPGSAPLLAAASAWSAVAAELSTAAAGYHAIAVELLGAWRGPTAMTAAQALAGYTGWLQLTAGHAEQTALQAHAAANAYETARAATVAPPVIAANRALNATLIATNLLGQNATAIAATEAHYTAMWAQNAAAMHAYATASTAATVLPSWSPPTRGGRGADTGAASAVPVTATASTAAESTLPSGPWEQFNWLSRFASETGSHVRTVASSLGFVVGAAGLTKGALTTGAAGALGTAGAGAAPGGIAGAAGGVGSAAPRMAATATAGLARAGALGPLSVPPAWGVAAGNAAPLAAATPSTATTSNAMLGPVGAPLAPLATNTKNSTLGLPDTRYLVRPKMLPGWRTGV